MKTKSEYQTAYKRRQRARGLCASCRAPWPGRQDLCVACRARKSAREQVKRAAAHAARATAGLPPRTHGWNGFQHRPQDVHHHTPERQREIAIQGSQVACAKRKVRATYDLLADVHRRLLDVRSIFTPEQIKDLDPIFVRVHRLGIERGIHREQQKAQRAKATMEAA